MLHPAFAVILAIGAGVSIVIQQALNAGVRASLGSAAWAGFASYLVGLASMIALIVALRDPVPSAGALARVPWWGWSGGVFGAVFIALAVVLVPEIGAAAFISLLVAGQMMASVAFDHFGALGLEPRPIDLPRLVGVVLLVAGVVLIRR